MTRSEYKKICEAIACFINGEPSDLGFQPEDHNPDVGDWETGMKILDNLRIRYLKRAKETKEMTCGN